MRGYVTALIFIVVCLAVLMPFASSDPDGLEMTAYTLGIEENKITTTGLMPDYTVPAIENAYSSTLAAGVIGIFLVLCAAILLGKIITKTNNFHNQ